MYAFEKKGLQARKYLMLQHVLHIYLNIVRGLPWLKNDLIQARKLCNIFRFIDDLILINDHEEYEVIYCNICGE